MRKDVSLRGTSKAASRMRTEVRQSPENDRRGGNARMDKGTGAQRPLEVRSCRSPGSPHILVQWTQESSQYQQRLAYSGLVKPSNS